MFKLWKLELSRLNLTYTWDIRSGYPIKWKTKKTTKLKV
jgi:hypothetical protein